MLGYCPSCAKESRLTRLHKSETLLVKGEPISLEVEHFQCLECGRGFPDPAFDPGAAAVREYRRRRGMLQPEEIRAFRSRYGLSQRELSGLLGFGGATLSRYENGALQDEAHNALLRLARQPANLLSLVEGDRAALSPEKRAQLTARLRAEVEREGLIRLIDRKGMYARPNPFNGQKELDLQALLNSVKILCFRKDVHQAKLSRLLFYADFKHYQSRGQGITGLCYARRASGPAPDQAEVIYPRLAALDPALTVAEEPSLDREEIYFRCEQEPDRSSISFSELQTLIEVDACFKSFSAAAIARHARGEDGWQRTPGGELISYEYARRLRI
jgi:putative zinc finger/helix-turn-helix YgiT family protein